MNFGGLGPDQSDFSGASFVVVPVPYDLTSTYQSGSRRGPGAILDASGNMELYDEELGREICTAGIHTATFVEADARGPAEMTATVRNAVAEVLAKDKIPVILGGEHSISLGAVQAMKGKYPGLSVLQLDAHADMRDAYQGSPYSHASVARRISELCPLVQAGIRSMSVEEAAFLKTGPVKTYAADRIGAMDGWCGEICGHLEGDVYVTIDLDVLDPAIMPSTGTPEPGGISWKEILQLLRHVTRRCRVRGFDVVELAPRAGMVAPDFLAAKLIYRFMGYLTERTQLSRQER